MKPDEIRNIIEDFLSHNSYDTGWIACSDWTNQHLGDTVGGNVNHALDAPLSDLLVKVLISTDGTDENSFEAQVTTLRYSDSGSAEYMGINIYEIDSNNIKVQTGQNGIAQIQDDGTYNKINSESWYYKIKVIKLWY